jgi:putative ABC transport system permease protein
MDLGFRIDDIDEATVRLPQPEYNAERMRVLVPELSQALDSAGFTAVALAAPGRSTGEARVPGPDNQTRPVERFDVSPSYFNVLDIPIVAGRSLIDGDRDRGLVVVNETLARLLWGGEEAVGRAFVVDDRPLEVIGVVRDAKLLGLGPPPPIYFAPLTGPRGALFPTVLVRRRQSADTAGLSQLIRRLEPRAEVTWAPMRDRIDFELEALRLAPLAASVLGLFALGLATVGMFGVFAYSVRQRSRDIGIRLALGARSRDAIAGVLATSARAVVYGLGAGVLAAAGASQLLRRSLYGVSPLDPVTYAGVALIIAAAAMVASYAPARRAVEVNPVSLLREE